MNDRNSLRQMSASLPENLESLMSGITDMKDSARQLETNIQEKQVKIESLMAEIETELDEFKKEAREQNFDLEIEIEKGKTIAQNWQVAIAIISESITSDIPILQDQLKSVRRHVFEQSEAIKNASEIARKELEKRPGQYREVAVHLTQSEAALSLHIQQLRTQLEAVKVRIYDRADLLSQKVNSAEKMVGDRVHDLNEIFAKIGAKIETKFDNIDFNIVQNTIDKLQSEIREKVEVELTDLIEVTVGNAIASLDRLTERLVGDREEITDRREALSTQFEELEKLLNELTNF